MLSETTRIYLLSSGLLPWVLLLLMLLMVEIGWRTGRFVVARYGTSKSDSSDVFMNAIFGLLALLIAFTFSGASDRFDHRRVLITQEVGTIGGAYLSIDLLNKEDQPLIRQLFKDYLNHRITLYQDAMNIAELEKKNQAQSDRGNQLWLAAVSAVKDTDSSQRVVAAQLLTQISSMFDAFDNQRLAMKFHPPPIIWQSLIFLALIGSLLSGYNMGIEQTRDWLLTIVFVALMVGAIYVILNLEYPRVGSISLSDFDRELILLRESL